MKSFKAVAGNVGPINVVKLVRTCIACPAQWDGLTDDDREVYVRYRYGAGEVCVGPVGDHSEYAAVGPGADRAVLFERLGDNGWDGDLAESELFAATAGFVTWPAMEDARYPDAEDESPVAESPADAR